MAKLETLSLEELYGKKMTSSVERVIMLKEDFSKKAPLWCEKVCKLNCKNPPTDDKLVPQTEVDILIVQDYKAFDDPKFFKKGVDIERKHLEVIEFIAKRAFGKSIKYAVTSLLKCGLQKQDIKKGKAPTDTVLAKCKPYLMEEIKRRKPKVIISLSTAATKAMGLKKSNYGNRGEIFNNVIFTLHPRTLLMLRQNSSGKFWGPDFFSIILRDFRKAAAVVRGDLKNPNLDVAIEKVRKQIVIARSLDQVKDLCKELTKVAEEGKVLSYDTETTGLDPFSETAKLITAQFGYRSDDGTIRAIVFPTWHRNNVWYDANEAWKFIEPILSNPEFKKIGHHIKFDILYTFATTGCRLRGVLFDTMLLLHSINSGVQGNYGLKQAVWDYLPHTELGGYEDRLPPLTTAKQLEKLDQEDEEDDDYESVESQSNESEE